MIKHVRTTLLTAILALGITHSALAAVNVSVLPGSQTLSPGGSASVDLMISGLSGTTLGGFFFDLQYDPTVLSASSVLFGDKLNSVPGSPQQFSDISTPGLIHLDEVSFEDPGWLASHQPDTFSLATLSFSGLAEGTSPLDFMSGSSLSDEEGNAIASFQLVNGSLTVKSSATVPEVTTTLGLLLFAMAPLALLRRRAA